MATMPDGLEPVRIKHNITVLRSADEQAPAALLRGGAVFRSTLKYGSVNSIVVLSDLYS